jgi:exodeoxyribonuclease V alpha subunit
MATHATQAIDTAFARFIGRMAAPTLGDEDRTQLMRLATLVSILRTEGHSCLALTEVANQSITLDEAAAWRCPSVEACVALLQRAGVASLPEGSSTTPLVIDGSRVYLRRYHAAERRLAAAIRARTGVRAQSLAGDALVPLTPLFRSLFPRAATRLDWQALAATAALLRPLVVVTGGPGTGKTTVAARMLALLLSQDPEARVALAAPTGRAAARLAESMGQAVAREALPEVVRRALPTEGRTLHKLLGYVPPTDRFRHTAEHPLTEDIVLIDEASMVDVLMMDAVLSALKPTARLIILGDPDQLASVETGFVLGDLVEAAGARCPEAATRHGALLASTYQQLAGAEQPPLVTADMTPLRDAVVRLHHSWRFGQRPGIGGVAAAASLGDADGVLAALQRPEWSDARLLPLSTGGEGLLAALEGPLTDFLAADTPEAALSALARFRVLCAVREGPQGVAGITALVERWLGRRGHSPVGWYDHRPVLVTENDEVTGLHNGDVGVTLHVDGVPAVFFADAGGGVRRLAPARLPAVDTAWAMTVHKAQGSEFDHVLVVLPDEPVRNLTRELVYTAVTRARASVTIAGSSDVLRTAVSRGTTRHSGLAERLRA